MENVEVVVEDWPDSGTLRLAGVRNAAGLLGFYHGIPLTQRTAGYNLVAPDKISIYRRPILLHCRTTAEVRETVQRVVRHEIAHYFGIDDERLRKSAPIDVCRFLGSGGVDSTMSMSRIPNSKRPSD